MSVRSLARGLVVAAIVVFLPRDRCPRGTCRPHLVLVALSALGPLAGILWCGPAVGQGTLSPLTTFGSNGWLAPGSNPYITTTNDQRGFGWNPVTKNLVVPSTSAGNFVAILDGTTGAVVKTMDTTGVAGGTRAMMGAGVSDDGEICVPNLQSGSSNLSPFKIYKWSSESSANAPTVAFSQVNPQTTSGAFRFGDCFAVYVLASPTSMPTR